MSDDKNSSVEEAYREIILNQLKDHDISLKHIDESVNKALNEILGLKYMLIGVDEKTGLFARMKIIEEENKRFEKFKTQIISIFLVLQVLGGVVFSLIMKLI